MLPNRLLPYAVAALVCLCCSTDAASPLSSPEGTLTDYVQAKETLVYPPRSVRAQKVEFDTPDKQMIHEPDTPFRQFFNAHSPDFKDGKLDYAKTTILGDTISMLRNKRFIRDMVEEVVSRHKRDVFLPPDKTNTTDATELALMEKKSELFVNAVALALERENYPDLRDEDIMDVLAKIDSLGADPAVAASADKIEQQNRKIYETLTNNVGLTNAHMLMGWDLRQALRERRYFSNIIDRAVSHRADLFRTTSSPVEPMKAAQKVLDTFVRDNITETHSTNFATLKLTLWESLIQSASDAKILIKQGTSSDSMSPAELKIFGDLVLKELTESLKTNKTAEAAIKAVLIRQSGYLLRTEVSTAAFITTSKNKLEADANVTGLYKTLTTRAAATASLKTKLDDKRTLLVSAENEVRAKAELVNAELPAFQGGIQALKGVKDKDPSAVMDTKIGSGTPPERTLMEWVTEGHTQALQATNKQKLPELKGFMDSLNEKNVGLVKLKQKLAGEAAIAHQVGAKTDEFIAKPNETLAAYLRDAGGKFTPLTDAEKQLGADIQTGLSNYVATLKLIVDANSGITNAAALNRAHDVLADKGKSVVEALAGTIQEAADQHTGGKAALGGDGPKTAFTNLIKEFGALRVAQLNVDSVLAPHTAAIMAFDEEFTKFTNSFTSVFKAADSGKSSVISEAITSALPGLLESIQKELLPARSGENGTMPALSALLTGILKLAALSDTADSQNKLIASFTRLFNGIPELVSSKDPILVAILKSSKVQFGSPGYQAIGAGAIPPRFKEKLDKNATPTLDQIADALEFALQAPEVTYLFGSGEANRKAADAFKAEFYNAFKHRLAEALNAEREADYDYWWMTFYPKAIAVGENRFQGESILQVNFNENMVPSEQYHRWLQDQYLVKEDLSELKKVEAGYSQKIRLATGVLNDFLVVLDSPNLSRRYPELRETIQEAMAKMTQRPDKSHHDVKENIKQLCFNDGMAHLMERAKDRELQRLRLLLEGVKQNALNSFPTNGLDPRFISYESHCENLKVKVLTGISLSLKGEKWDVRDVFKTHYGLTNSFSVVTNTIFQSGTKSNTMIVTNASVTIENKAALLFAEAYFNYTRDGILPFIVMGSYAWGHQPAPKPYKKIEDFDRHFLDMASYLGSFELGTRTALAWESFDERHVAFAVVAAILKNATLPEKVEGYANAFFDGSRKFASEYTLNDQQALKRFIANEQIAERMKYEKYVVPFEDVAQQFDMARYLLMKGLDHQSVAHLLVRYQEKYLAPNSWYMSSGIVELVKLLGPGNYDVPNAAWQNRTNRSHAGLVLQDFLRQMGERSLVEQRTTAREFFRDVQYLPDARPSKYLEYPVLWQFEKDLDAMQEQLRFVTVSLYHSSYPAIPPLKRISSDFLQNDGHLRSLIYLMLRDLFLEYSEREILAEQDIPSLIETGNNTSRSFARWLLIQPLDVASIVNSREYVHAWGEMHRLWTKTQSPEGNGAQHYVDLIAKAHEIVTQAQTDAVAVHLFCANQTNSTPTYEAKVVAAAMMTNICSEMIVYAKKVVELAHAKQYRQASFSEENKLRTRRVLATLLLDRHPYLTDDSRKHFLEVVTTYRSVFDWVEKLAANQRVMDQFSKNLLLTLYRPYFDSLDRLNKIERQPIPFEFITQQDFERFGYRNKPYLQRGIQIVDMLPASRDDLVSMSVNEGGMVAKIAAQAEGAAAYDLNMFQTALRNIEAQSLGSQKSSSFSENLTPDEALKSLSSLREGASQQKLIDLSSLKQAAGMSGYALGASAKGSVYARAQSAFAYARRREYLDAAITAAGRGDNFAKWVIRQSDLRSSQAGTDAKKLVAAAHNGQPNGDQPFHLLVKVPRTATHMDWDGRNYIFFNSSYTATGRKSFWRTAGWLGVLGKVPITIINHNWWSDIEKNTVSSVFPFTWNVKKGDSEGKLRDLVKNPSILGVKIHLDDTDKIRYSEVSGLLDAEANFIQLARLAQVQDLNRVMGEIQNESGTFRSSVINTLTNRVQEVQSTQSARKTAAELEAKQQALEQEMNRLRQELQKLKPGTPPATE